MSKSRYDKYEREMPRTDLYLIIIPILFFSVWGLDSFIFNISTVLNNYIPILIRFSLFVIFLILALIIMYQAHNILFEDHEPSDKLITTGILARVRHPLYMSILLLYLAFLYLSISLISIVLFFIIFFINNKMANFEEKMLIEIFGEQYLEYKKRVPKWIPKLYISLKRN